jgi:hypothetical protein
LKSAVIIAALFAGSSAYAQEPLTKEDQLAAALGRADACFDDRVAKLDDRVSPANVVAEAVVTACGNYVDDITAIAIKGKNYWYKHAYPAQQHDVSVQKATVAVLRHRTGN